MDTAPTTSRRSLLKAGGLTLAGAAFLAACGKDEITAGGISGTPASTTSTPATVPVTEPTQIALGNDVIQLRTASSVALLAAQIYDEYGSKLDDADWAAAFDRFATDHTDAAEAYADAVTDTPETVEPNEYLVTNMVEPAAEGLVDDRSILAFLSSFETMMAANAINAVGIYTQAGWRQKSIAYGAASARRAALLAEAAGLDPVPDEALYSVADLMPGDAFLAPEAENAAEGS